MIITLRAARVNRGYTLKDVAEKVGKNIDTINKYEIDSTNIPRSLMVDLLKLYEIDPDNIFFGKELDFIEYNRIRKEEPHEKSL